MAQAREVASRLEALGVACELVPMATAGDRGAGASASPSGAKGLFVAEIVGALQEGALDVAVHSAKDLPSADPPGVVVCAVPERADPFDVLVARDGRGLRRGASVGTSSLRRRAQLLRAHPEVSVREVRGNVDTRLRRLEEGEIDFLVLAAAGLARLEIAPEHATPLPLEEMVPAPGQGALAVQVRAGDRATMEVVARLDHTESRRAFEAERGLVARLGAGCALPLGAYAEDRGDGVRLMAVVLRPDGSELLWAQVEAPTPERAAEEVAGTLLAAGAAGILGQGPSPS